MFRFSIIVYRKIRQSVPSATCPPCVVSASGDYIVLCNFLFVTSIVVRISVSYAASLFVRILFLVSFISFIFTRRIFTPLAMDQFAWTRSQATLWVGIIFFAAGCIAVFTFAMADVLEKRYAWIPF